MDLQVSTPPSALYNYSADTTDEEINQRNTAYGVRSFALTYLLTRTTPPSVDTKWFEAEDAVLVSPMAVQANSGANGGLVIGTPTGGSVNNNTTTPSAVYNLTTTTTAYYHIWARVYAPNTNANSLYCNFDDYTPTSIYTNTFGSWVWMNCGSTQLTPGKHQLKITYEEPGLLIDTFVVTTDYNLVPSGLGQEQHYLDAANFSINNSANVAVKTTDGLATGGDATTFTNPAFLGTTKLNTTLPAAGTTGDAQKTVGLNGGSYDIWARLKAPTSATNGFYFSLDNGAYSAVTLPAGSAYNDWIWQKVASSVSLVAGSHVLNVSSDKATTDGKTGCEVDRFFVAAAGTAGPVEPNKYLTVARFWAQTSMSYPTWGKGSFANNDMAAASQLSGLGLYYDWCYNDLSLDDRQAVSSLIASRGALFYQGYTGDKSGGVSTPYWRNYYLNNLFWNYSTELTTAALAIHGDSGMPDTLPWLQATLDGMANNTFNDFGPDGADHEGPNYWCSIIFPLQYMDLAKKELGVDLTGTPWFQQTGFWRLYMSTALDNVTRTYSGPQLTFADCVTQSYYGPDHILRKLASLYNQPTQQWLAGRLDDSKNNDFNVNPGVPTFEWLNLLWYNASIAETSPAVTGLSYFSHFPDLDFAVSRTGWDNNEAVVGFQCGPYQGHQVQSTDKPYTNWGAGHEHPAANNFCFFYNGEFQIMNAGYTDKFSKFENTLLVNSAGQLGEGGFTFNGSAASTEDPSGTLNPAIDTSLSFSTTPMDYLVGQASGAYPSSAGVSSFKRHLLYLKPDVLVAVDDVTLRTASQMELHFDPWQLNGVAPNVSGSGNSYVLTGMYSKMNFNVLTLPATATTSYVNIPFTDNGASTNHSLFKLATASGTPLTSMSTAVAMSASTLTGTPRPVVFQADADQTAWKFKVGTLTMVLDRNVTANAPDEKARLVTCLEAESVSPASPMFVYTDEPDAQGGKYIAAAPGTAINQPDTLPSASVQYTLGAPAAGTYTLWARIKAADGNSDSFWYALNPTGSGAYTSICTTSTFGSWVWVKMTTTSFATATSTNALAIKYRQAGARSISSS